MDKIDLKRQKTIAKIQAWFKRRACMKQYKAMKKRARYRLCVIKEIIKTELDYVNDIMMVVEQIQKPACEQLIITEQEDQQMFINLKDIASFNQGFLKSLQKSFDNFWTYKQVFLEASTLIERFRIYFDYCNGFSSSVQKVMEVCKNNQSFQELLSEKKKKNKFRGMNLDDFLVKPVQRLPKYVLLFKDLLKHTDLDHPDFQNISQTLEQFKFINEENNKSMDKFMNRLRMKDLENQFQVALMGDEDRLFRFEETYNILWNEVEQSVIIYAMTDIILVIKRDEQDGSSSVMKNIQLNSLSFVKDQPDSKYFSNLFQLVGQNDAIQFICKKEGKTKSIAIFEQYLEELREFEKLKQEKC